MADLYNVLGVSRQASADEIRSSYKKLAMKYHPDRNKSPGAEAKFKEIQQAHAVLSDDKKRSMYDRFGTADASQLGAQGGSFGGNGGFEDIFSGFDSVFSGFSSSQSSSSVDRNGRNISIQLELELADAAYGSEHEVRITGFDTCQTCDASGNAPGTRSITCTGCGGAGVIQQRIAIMTFQQPCARCGGAGTIPEKKCETCSGSGRVRRRRSIALKMPAGIDQDDVVRMRGKGEAGLKGGRAGDLLVHVKLSKHPVFERDGDNLLCTIPIPFITAVTGGKLDVPALNQQTKTITVPKGVQSGTEVRIRGAGIKGVRSMTAGDLICELTIETPQNLNKKQLEALQEFNASLSKSNAPRQESWLHKAKKIFN